MNKNKNMKTTQKYCTPDIELIRLDREISLQLQSEDSNPLGDPTGPGWSAVNQKDHFNTDLLQEFKA